MKMRAHRLNVAALSLWLLASPSHAQISMPWPGPGGVAGKLNCTGGSQTTSGPNTILTFSSNSTLICTGSGTLTYLIIGAGNNGGAGVLSNSNGGGGGAGQFLTGTATLFPGSFPVVVGASAGASSSLNSVGTAIGGGVGGTAQGAGGTGASGGGGSAGGGVG